MDIESFVVIAGYMAFKLEKYLDTPASSRRLQVSRKVTYSFLADIDHGGLTFASDRAVLQIPFIGSYPCC